MSSARTAGHARQEYEIVQVRLLLEPEAVRLAISRATAKNGDAVRRAAQAVERARGDTPAFVPLDRSFHRLAWTLWGNAVLARDGQLPGGVRARRGARRHGGRLATSGARLGLQESPPASTSGLTSGAVD